MTNTQMTNSKIMKLPYTKRQTDFHSQTHDTVHTWSGRTVQKDSSVESEDRESEWTLVRRDCMSSYTHAWTCTHTHTQTSHAGHRKRRQRRSKIRTSCRLHSIHTSRGVSDCYQGQRTELYHCCGLQHI